MTQRSYARIYDALLQLEDGAAATTSSEVGQVSSADAELDLGGDGLETPASVAGAGFLADLVIDISAIKVSAGDELYGLEWQLSNDDFASETIVACSFPVGDTAVTNSTADTPAGRIVQPVSNVYAEQVFRYARLYKRVSGTSPSITLTAFLSKIGI